MSLKLANSRRSVSGMRCSETTVLGSCPSRSDAYIAIPSLSSVLNSGGKESLEGSEVFFSLHFSAWSPSQLDPHRPAW
jgi:hypothetical protein